MSTPSLLCVPYRLKAGTLYSQIPDSGLGDFVVTRSASNSATRVNAAGLIETVLDNVPRLDYPLGGITAGCPALLVEPSAVNYLVRSQEFDNASWGKNATGIDTSIGTSGIQANVAVSPDGTQNADRVNFVLQTDPDLGLNQNYAAATSTQTYNTSIWFKGEGTNIGKQIKVQIKRTSGGIFVGTTATITLTSGWVRFASSAITLGASNSGVQVIISSNDATNALIWGAQLEQGSVPTSYIPTTTASVTRSAETISKTGVSSLIGQTEGTIYAQAVYSSIASTKTLVAINDGTVDNRIALRIVSTTSISATVVVANISYTISATIPAIPSSGVVKMALGYKADDYALAINGTIYPFTTTRPVPPTTAVFLGNNGFGADFLNDRISADALYPTRLPNTAAPGVLSLTTLTT